MRAAVCGKIGHEWNHAGVWNISVTNGTDMVQRYNNSAMHSAGAVLTVALIFIVIIAYFTKVKWLQFV